MFDEAKKSGWLCLDASLDAFKWPSPVGVVGLPDHSAATGLRLRPQSHTAFHGAQTTREPTRVCKWRGTTTLTREGTRGGALTYLSAAGDRRLL